MGRVNRRKKIDQFSTSSSTYRPPNERTFWTIDLTCPCIPYTGSFKYTTRTGNYFPNTASFRDMCLCYSKRWRRYSARRNCWQLGFMILYKFVLFTRFFILKYHRQTCSLSLTIIFSCKNNLRRLLWWDFRFDDPLDAFITIWRDF